MAGYGLEDMKGSLDYAYEKLGADKAVVAIIPHDIYRIRIPMTSNENCSMYQSSMRCGDSPTWWHHPKDLDDKNIISFAKSKYDFGIIPVLRKPLMNKFKPILKSLIRKSNRSELISSSISAMDSMIARYGAQNVILIILPTKQDLDLIQGSLKEKARINADLRLFLDYFSKKILIKDLRDCPLDKSHFFQNDGHPNEQGHKLLGKCALNQLKTSKLY